MSRHDQPDRTWDLPSDPPHVVVRLVGPFARRTPPEPNHLGAEHRSRGLAGSVCDRDPPGTQSLLQMGET